MKFLKILALSSLLAALPFTAIAEPLLDYYEGQGDIELRLGDTLHAQKYGDTRISFAWVSACHFESNEFTLTTYNVMNIRGADFPNVSNLRLGENDRFAVYMYDNDGMQVVKFVQVVSVELGRGLGSCTVVVTPLL